MVLASVCEKLEAAAELSGEIPGARGGREHELERGQDAELARGDPSCGAGLPLRTDIHLNVLNMIQ